MMPVPFMLIPGGGFFSPYPVMVEWMLDSVAVLVTVSNARAFTVVWKITGSTGATFTSLTITVKLFVALSAGIPLSVTLTRIVFVDGLCVCAGTQLITPVTESIVMPAGAVARSKVKAWAGMSKSVAVFVIVRVVSSSTVWLGTEPIVGRAFNTTKVKT